MIDKKNESYAIKDEDINKIKDNTKITFLKVKESSLSSLKGFWKIHRSSVDKLVASCLTRSNRRETLVLLLEGIDPFPLKPNGVKYTNSMALAIP